MSETEHKPSRQSNIDSRATPTDDDVILAAVADDLAARLRHGECPQMEEYVRRHPDLAGRIRNVFQAVALMEGTHTKDLEAGSERPGDVIGRYKLLEQIGEGGFGVVFMAEQQEPVRRKVALKVIKPGFDTRQVIARFEAERQALALMDHENIAKVLDAGATASGRPYFVMELIHGVPVTDFCDQNQIPTDERLELFIDVCRAVQHAHTKGIIHRDIKPTNVLVTLHEGVPVPKVIDFGVAKATGQQLTEKTLFTQFAQMVGTPLYMSPEQAEMTSMDVDTRSDVYSLGVLLYELLTGTTPLDSERLRKAAFDEVRRLIREVEPPTPSIRLSTMGQHARSIAARRKRDPKQLGQVVRGELDWIVMKALEKDRARRYETPNALARDIECYLRDEPVGACPPSIWYRFRKFARRRKAVLGVALGVILSILAGTSMLAVSSVRVSHALHQETEAKARLEIALARERGMLERERRDSYSQRIALASRMWSANNLVRMGELLDECPADLCGWEWRYLKGLRYSTRRPLRHDSPVLGAAFSPDGRYLATAAQSGSLRLWQTKTGQLIREWSAHAENADAVAFSPDGRYLASGSMDATAKVWETTKLLAGEVGEPFLELKHENRVWSVAFSPNGNLLATAAGRTTSDSGEAKVVDFRSRQAVLTLRFPNRVSCVQFSPDSRRLAAALDRDSLRVWDIETHQEQLACDCRDQELQWVAFSPDGRSLATVGGNISVHPNREVGIWDAHSGQKLNSLTGHVGGLHCVAFSPDGSRVASAGLDQTVRLWDAASGQELLTLHGHLDNIWCVTFSADGYLLASSSVDNTVRIWDGTPPGSEPTPECRTLTGHTAAATDVTFRPTDGLRLASASTDGSVRIWDTSSGNPLSIINVPASTYATRLAYSPDGQHLAVASDVQDGISVKIWDTTSVDDTRSLPGNTSADLCVEFSPDGQYVASGGFDYVVRIRETATGNLLPPLVGHTWPVLGLAFSPDGQQLASASSDRTVRIWDWRRGEVLQVLEPGHTTRVQSVAFSHDGKRLASASWDRTIKLWDSTTWQLIDEVPDPSGAALCVAFSRDGRLAWGSSDSTVKIWNGHGREIQVLRGHASWVQAIEFSPDDQWIASASLDRTVKLWPVPSGFATESPRSVHAED